MPETLKFFLKKQILNVLRVFKFYRSYSFIPRGEIDFPRLTAVKVLNVNEYEAVKRAVPKTTDAKMDRKFEDRLDDVPQKTFVLEAKDWRVWGNQGAVITDTGYLFKDVSREFENPNHSILQQFKLVPPILLNGTSAVITASGVDMYYHWMVDILPRIKLLIDCNLTDRIDHYILDYRDTAFQNEALAALNIDICKVSRANDHFNYHIVAEHLIVPSLPSKINVVSADTCRFLVDTFLAKRPSGKSGKKIYLKRTKKRKIINQAEIEDYLESMGFESLQCENYTIAEQASIFYNADVIIGPHGAAFTNIIFCKPGTRVIEFFSPKWINPCYWTISNEVGLDYYYLIGEGNASEIDLNADVLIDLNKLKQSVEQFNLINNG
ncbi:MAG: Capsular polysaccharide biosynthesis protein [Mucilaginibacter sp.]|nr:Capsular polysaccharide biosynthesis protein [Mucilaginibacter sp.]